MLLAAILSSLDRLETMIETLDELFYLVLLEASLHEAEEFSVIGRLHIQERAEALKE